jgi:hypothetical protein
MYKDTTERKVTENWVVRVQTLWKEFGMFGVWENQGSLYKNKTVKIPKSNMLDRYEHNWLAHVGLSPTFGTTGTKLRTYIQFKHTFGLENYILVERKFQRRQNMAKLRISAHSLCIETGRYRRPPTPPEQRLCQLCSSGAVENEQHFVLECSLYADERRKLMNTLYNICPGLVNLQNTEKFNFIISLNNGDPEFVEPVLQYLTVCFEKRSDTIAV